MRRCGAARGELGRAGRHLHQPGAPRAACAQGAGQPADQGRPGLDDLSTTWPHISTCSGPTTARSAVTQEITVANPLYTGMTWDALAIRACSGMRRRAPTRLQPALQVAEQPACRRPTVACAWSAAPVLYDGGNLFSLTTQMARHVVWPARRPCIPADADRLGLADGDCRPGAQRTRHDSAWPSSSNPPVKPGTVWIPASLPGAPVGALLNGGLEVVALRNKAVLQGPVPAQPTH